MSDSATRWSRAGRIAVGLIAASIAASLALHLFQFAAAPPGWDALRGLDGVLGTVPLLGGAILLLASLPALAAIIVAAHLRISNPLLAVLVGAGIPLLEVAVAVPFAPAPIEPATLAMLVAAGALAGGVYWATVGRGRPFDNPVLSRPA